MKRGLVLLHPSGVEVGRKVEDLSGAGWVHVLLPLLLPLRPGSVRQVDHLTPDLPWAAREGSVRGIGPGLTVWTRMELSADVEILCHVPVVSQVWLDLSWEVSLLRWPPR